MVQRKVFLETPRVFHVARDAAELERRLDVSPRRTDKKPSVLPDFLVQILTVSAWRTRGCIGALGPPEAPRARTSLKARTFPRGAPKPHHSAARTSAGGAAAWRRMKAPMRLIASPHSGRYVAKA